MMRVSVYLFVPVLIFSIDISAQADTASSAPMPCVEVQIGQDSASHMDCVNDALRRVVEREHNRPVPEAPVSANSASNQVGTFNEAASRQMMGDTFGISSVPQRPKSAFTNALVPVAH